MRYAKRARSTRIGVSIRDYRPEDGVDLAQFGLVDSLQVVFNMFEQRPATTLFPAAAESRTACIARVPFDSGSLIGNWTEDTYATWPEDSVPAWLFRGERFGETLRRVAALKELCAPLLPDPRRGGHAVRAVLPGQVSTVIPGMLTPAEVDMNVAYSDGAPFPPELLVQPRGTRLARGTSTGEHAPQDAPNDDYQQNYAGDNAHHSRMCAPEFGAACRHSRPDRGREPRRRRRDLRLPQR